MKKKNTILIIDDTEMNRAMLADMLTENYEIIEAADGEEGVRILYQQHNDISLVLLDIVMPKMDGFEVLAVMNKNDWILRIPVITISAETSSTYIDHAYDLGATDYISRPFEEKTVQRRVRNTIMLYQKQKMLENMVIEQITEKEKNNLLMVEILSNIVEFRNGESGRHVLHIRTLTEVFLRQLRQLTDQYPLTASRIALIVNASSLHDIGKISIPEEILNKPGRLTPAEFEIMKTHSAIGAQIMEDALQRHPEELLLIACNICRWHHERYNGKGYPDGLEGDAIPIEAQVVALADVYDALTNVRVYKPAFSHEVALQMILNGECGVFNPLLLTCLKEASPYLEQELKTRSLNNVSESTIRDVSTQMFTSGQVSDRTLTLLEQERVKYQFFASMSNEIQFEYRYQTDLLTISDWGARQLGLNVMLEHPEENEAMHKVFSRENYLDIKKRLREADPTNPIIHAIYCLHVKGQDRWYKAVARPLWEDNMGEIVSVIGKFVDVHEEQLRLNHLKRMAEEDSLTKLNNHTFAMEYIAKAILAKEKKFAIILLDLDHFKNANDRYGHQFGDQILIQIAGKIKKTIRPGDIAARVGGDEFLLFLNYEGASEPIAQEVFHALKSQYQAFDISVSMGIALFPENGADYNALFHAADQALYAAKRDGKDRYYFYDDSMKELLSVLSPMDH